MGMPNLRFSQELRHVAPPGVNAPPPAGVPRPPEVNQLELPSDPGGVVGSEPQGLAGAPVLEIRGAPVKLPVPVVPPFARIREEDLPQAQPSPEPLPVALLRRILT